MTNPIIRTALDVTLLVVVTACTLRCALYLRTAFCQGRVPGLRLRTSMLYLAAGWLLVAIGLLIPEVLHSESFAPQVTAHAMLGLVAPPFFLLAVPRALAWDLVPTPRRKRWVRGLTNPYVAGGGFEAYILFTHMPGIYELVTGNAVAETFLRGSLLAYGLLYWWPIVEPLPVWGTYAWIWKIVYLFMSRIPLFSLGIGLTLSETLVFDPSVFSSSVVKDALLEQQIAGAIFIAITNVVMLGAITAIAVPRLAALSQE